MWGKANLGANIGLWALAGDGNNYNNVLAPSSRQNILNRLGTQPNIANRLGTKQNIASRLGPQQNMGNQKWSNVSLQKLNSKIKRLNQENKPRFNAFNPNTNKNKGKTVNKTIEDKKCEDDLPTEALFCYMCDLGGFGSISDYISHLEAANHNIMAQAYKSKCTANLELFRAEAKIISHRVFVKDGTKNSQRETQYCHKCQCQVVGGLSTHEKSSEHLHVSNYLGIRCCGTSFNSRIELEEHWLSLQHIQFRSKMFAKYKDHGLSLQNEEENRQKVSARATAEPHYDVSSWPAFDPTVPLGLKYVDIGASYKCSVCCDYLEPLAIVILNHCSSSKHYQKMCIFFKTSGNTIKIFGLKSEMESQTKNIAEAKDENIISEVKNEKEIQNKKETEVKENPAQDKSEEEKVIPSTETKDASIVDSKEDLVQEKSGEVKAISSNVESVLEGTKSNDSSNTEVKNESEEISNEGKPDLSEVSTADKNESEPVDDYGTVLDPSILLDESKNESMLDDKSDADNCELKNEDKNGAEDQSEDITKKEQEDITEREQDDILSEQESKDVSDNVQEQDDVSAKLQNKDSVNEMDSKEQEESLAEKQNGGELSSSSTSLSNKLFVITEEECDECENGSGECQKHSNKMGSPKRRNSEETVAELGTPKKLRTEEPAVATPTRRSRRRSMSEEPTISTPTRNRRKSITEEPKVSTPTRTSTRRKSISQL